MMDMFMALMVTWLYIYPQTHQVVYTIYTVFKCQSNHNKVVKVRFLCKFYKISFLNSPAIFTPSPGPVILTDVLVATLILIAHSLCPQCPQ